MRLSARGALVDGRRSTEETDDCFGDLARRRSEIDDQRILVRPRFLERVDLALQQACRHEMIVAARQMPGDMLAAATKIDQPCFRSIIDDDLAIRWLEGGAGDNTRLLLSALTVDPSGHALEPRLSIRIGQRNAGMHLGNVRFRMKRVAFLESPAETCRQFLCDC